MVNDHHWMKYVPEEHALNTDTELRINLKTTTEKKKKKKEIPTQNL